MLGAPVPLSAVSMVVGSLTTLAGVSALTTAMDSQGAMIVHATVRLPTVELRQLLMKIATVFATPITLV